MPLLPAPDEGGVLRRPPRAPPEFPHRARAGDHRRRKRGFLLRSGGGIHGPRRRGAPHPTCGGRVLLIGTPRGPGGVVAWGRAGGAQVRDGAVVTGSFHGRVRAFDVLTVPPRRTRPARRRRAPRALARRVPRRARAPPPAPRTRSIRAHAARIHARARRAAQGACACARSPAGGPASPLDSGGDPRCAPLAPGSDGGLTASGRRRDPPPLPPRSRQPSGVW